MAGRMPRGYFLLMDRWRRRSWLLRFLGGVLVMKVEIVLIAARVG